MKNTINYHPDTYKDDFPICPVCNTKQFAVYQCTCGAIFCKNCAKENIKKIEDDDMIEITCPKCGTTVLFV